MSPGTKDTQIDSDSSAFFQGGGDMGERIRSFNWSKHPLGSLALWPRSLKTVVRIMLASRQPIWIGWGSELYYLYNDPYKAIIGGKHPEALGQPAAVVWREIWPEISPMLATAMTSDIGTYVEEHGLIMERNGYPEETYYTFSYTPIPDDTGASGGVICANTDDTQRAIGERQLKLLRKLAFVVANLHDSREVYEATAKALSHNDKDLPFSLLYVAEKDAQKLRLVATTGLTRGNPAAPDELDPDEPSVWPVGDLMPNLEPVLLDSLPFAADGLPAGGWPVPPSKAVLLPINVSGRSALDGVLIVGVNPYRLFDEAYRGFLLLVAGQVSAGIAAAEAYENARRRAEALAELDRAKTGFFNNISHEFRTPLTLMLGPLSDTIAGRHGPLDRKVAKELIVVYRNGQRLLKLVNTLLEFSRIEAGRVEASFVPTDLAAFTADLASVFRSAIEQAGLTLIIESLPLPEPAYIDRDMWEKIVLNLISNAFKFTLRGKITVRVDRVETWMRLIVEDTGSGIPEEELSRLFERFYRVQNTKGRTHEGTGIGLALVHELVRIHGGQISVESELGTGSRFTVNIPAGKRHLPPEQILESAQPDFAATEFNPFVEEAIRWLPDPQTPRELAEESLEIAPKLGSALITKSVTGVRRTGFEERRCVLVADDNTDMRNYLRRLLAEQYDVLVAADGQEALQKARAACPELILSDVMMPNLDGFGLLRAIRDDSALAAIPVILLSARAGEDATLDGIRAGANDYLIKPFGARELLARVDAQIQRRRFEKELNAAEQRLQDALAAVRMVAWEWDPLTDKLNVSPTSAEVFGLRPGEKLATGESVFSLVHPEDRASHSAAVAQAAERGGNFRSEVRLIRPCDGRIAWLEVRGHVQIDKGGKKKMVGLSTDISDLKRAEHRLEETLVAEQVARAEAERVSRLKDEFLATLSHELRTPLTAILGWSLLLIRGPETSEKVREGLQVIERNARAQTQMIEDLLDMSRIISGKVRLDVQRLVLADVVIAALESVRPSAEVKGLRLRSVLDPCAGPVTGDANRLQQVVWNLLTNAIKFTPRGGQIQVILERVNSHLELTVSDTGEGIVPEFLPHIFERFRQADASTTRLHTGLGLGLSIVKQLVELHGGSVRAKSPGVRRGSTFIVLLPVAIFELAETGQESDREHPGIKRDTPLLAEPPSLSDLKILVVDDEPDARKLLKQILSERGASVVAASSAREALEIIARICPDLLVSDIGMPGTDGYQLIRRVRALGSANGGSVPAVALTAFARSEDRQRALLAGYQIHVAKPVEPTELIAVCASLAGRVG